MTDQEPKGSGFIAAALPVGVFIYVMTQVGTDIFEGMGVGAYLTLIAATAMMLSLVGVFHVPNQQAPAIATKKCPSCGTEYPASARFCSVDGYRFEDNVLTRSAESSAQPEIPSVATSEQQDAPQEHKSEEVAVDITTATPPVSEIVSASRIQAAPSTTSVQSDLEAFAASETVERQHQATPRSEIKRPAIPTWAIPLGGIIAAGLLGYLGLRNLCKSPRSDR